MLAQRMPAVSTPFIYSLHLKKAVEEGAASENLLAILKLKGSKKSSLALRSRNYYPSVSYKDGILIIH